MSKKEKNILTEGKPRRRFRWNMQSSMMLLFFLIMFASGAITGGICMLIYEFTSIPTDSTGWYFFVVLFFSTTLGTLFTFIFSRIWLKTAKDLSRAADEVSRGNFSVRVDEKYHRGEFREMIRAFNNMAEHLSHTEIFRSDFINYFSHEFKTPIVSMRGFARQLKKPNLTEEARKEYLQIIIDECDRLTRLASNILLLSQFENQKIVSSPTTFSVDEQIRTTLVLLEKEWSGKEIELDLEMDEIHITTNEEMLSLVWRNLLSNAIKYSLTGGKIQITCDDDGEFLHVVIADEGIGMSEETQKHIFEKFFQADTSHKTNGNGLGLALVKRIVDLCQGTIRVSSREGQGASFTVSLPKETNP